MIRILSSDVFINRLAVGFASTKKARASVTGIRRKNTVRNIITTFLFGRRTRTPKVRRVRTLFVNEKNFKNLKNPRAEPTRTRCTCRSQDRLRLLFHADNVLARPGGAGQPTGTVSGKRKRFERPRGGWRRSASPRYLQRRR